MNGKRFLTSVVALGTAAALALGGTFAWQSINQTALNEASDIVNPGGRLHDDFDGTDKNVYVENFADDEIFARVRLEEFFEIVLNAGTPGEKSVPMIGTKTPKLGDDDQPMMTENGNPIYDYEYVTFKDYQPGFSTDAGNVDEYAWWTWSTGGDTVFMPTFNKNKDSLKADINGEYKFDTGVITDKDIEGGQYTTMVTYEEDETKTAHAIYDIDSNKLDEIAQEDLAALIEGGAVPEAYQNNVKLLEETHTAKAAPAASLISMADWLEAVEEFGYGEGYDTCWVYDTDGWVYWSAPIASGEATGLLLDGIELNQVMDDSWYYAINVVGQFVTANDVGKENGTGFYQEEDEAPTTDAETLLETIGVDMSGEGGADSDDGDDENGQMLLFSLTQRDAEDAYPYSYYDVSATEGFLYDLDNHNENVFDVELGDGVTLSMSFENTKPGTSYEDGVLTLSPGDVSIITVTATYNGTDYTFKLTPVYSEIVITKGDGAETKYYRIPNGAYKLSAINFDGDVTYTVSENAMRSSIIKIDDAKHLTMGGYESAESYTVTATDGSGNTGTVTIFPMDTHAFDGAVFWLYQDYGEYGLHGIGQLIDTQTYYWSADTKYVVSVDLPVRPAANFTWTLTDDATGNAATKDQIDFSANDNVLTIKCGDSLTAEDAFTLKGTSDVELPTYGDGGTAKEYTFYLNFGERPEVGDDDDDEDSAAHTLTIEDLLADEIEVYDVAGDNNVIVVIDPTYDETDDGDETNLWEMKEQVTVYAQKKGDTDVFSCVAYDESITCVYPESNDKWNILVDCINEDVTFDNKAVTEYEIWLSVTNDDGSTTTSNKLTFKFWSQTATLTKSGTTDTLSKKYGTFLVVDGMTMKETMSGCTKDSSFINNIAVKKDGTEVELASYYTDASMERYNGTANDAQVLSLEIRYSTKADGEDSGENDCIVFAPKAVGEYEFTFTINGTPYTTTITVTE